MARGLALLLAASCAALARAGPLPPGAAAAATAGAGAAGAAEVCTVNNVTYALGAAVPGAACQRCACSARGVQCAREECAPRAGCKAVHRPDLCCPTYQCECEQDGHVYGNGERLVDPRDPCRVCYCQGGEVLCRRIACFLRDDCPPRRVPGRCCPHYDNCPLRGSSGDMNGTLLSNIPIEDVGTTAGPVGTAETNKQEITIKEITPVSEIPIITDVKIKEILPSPSAEPSSSKSPLYPREATTDSDPPTASTPRPPRAPAPPAAAHGPVVSVREHTTKEAPPKIGITTPHATASNSEAVAYVDSAASAIASPSAGHSDAATAATTVASATTTSAPTTRAAVIEEDDPALFEHNPAFPPLPDDLSVPRDHNHEPEQSPEDHASRHRRHPHPHPHRDHDHDHDHDHGGPRETDHLQ